MIHDTRPDGLWGQNDAIEPLRLAAGIVIHFGRGQAGSQMGLTAQSRVAWADSLGTSVILETAVDSPKGT